MGETLEKPEKPGVRGTSAQVNLARQLFMYGNGDGRPITEPAKLAEIAGVTPQTIYNHIRAWEMEREEILANQGIGGYSLQVSPATLRQHRETVDFYHKQEELLRREVQDMPLILKDLREVLRGLKESENYDEAVQAFQIFLKLYGNRRETLKLQMHVQQRLRQHSGIELLEEIAATREKTLASGRARLDVTREAKAAELKGGAITVPGDAAARDDAFAPDPDPVEPDEREWE